MTYFCSVGFVWKLSGRGSIC